MAPKIPADDEAIGRLHATLERQQKKKEQLGSESQTPTPFFQVEAFETERVAA
jgi:hypothetical protein